MAELLAFIKAVPVIDSWVRQFIALYIAGQSKETLSRISDAAAMGARALTDEERYKASEAWQKALSRPRITA
jgi:uncharacterized protein with von Willebrand factor type A (vWA) domain